jgi:hypothetical protein
MDCGNGPVNAQQCPGRAVLKGPRRRGPSRDRSLLGGAGEQKLDRLIAMRSNPKEVLSNLLRNGEFAAMRDGGTELARPEIQLATTRARVSRKTSS